MSRRRNLPLDTLELILEGVELIVSADGNITGGSMYPTRTIAKLFGVTDRHIQQLTKDGVLPATWGSCGRCGANWPRRLRERTEAVSCRTLAWHFLREDKEPDSL